MAETNNDCPAAKIDEMLTQLNAVVADNAALRASIVGITAQLDADATVTDETYASGNDPAASTSEAVTLK